MMLVTETISFVNMSLSRDNAPKLLWQDKHILLTFLLNAVYENSVEIHSTKHQALLISVVAFHSTNTVRKSVYVYLNNGARRTVHIFELT